MPDKTINLRLKVTETGQITLDKFAASLKNIETHAKSAGSSLTLIKWDAIVNLSQRAIQAGEAVYNFARSIASAGNDIQRMSRVFNMSTDDFQKWSYVTKMADTDMEGFGQAFKFLTRSMSEALQESGDAAKAFNLLGINLKDSTGRTKDQQTVMMEVIGTLEKYADGVNRDALMLAIFGRGWMSIKPLIDQGTKAIEENRREVERLNGILGKDLIKSLSESEDAFKKWEFTWKVAKTETFAPLVEILGSMLERIMALKRAWSEGGIKGIYKELIAGQEEEGIRQIPATTWVKEWVANWTPPVIRKKPEAPGLPSTGKEKAENAAQQELLKLEKEGQSVGFQTYQDKIKLLEIETKTELKEAEKYKTTAEYGGIVSQIYENQKKKLTELEKQENDRIQTLDTEFAKVLASTDEVRSSTENWEDALDDIPKGYAIINGEMKKIDDWASMTYRKELLSLQTLETRIAKERELRDAKVSLGWMRPAEAGLAGIEDEKKLLAERLALDEQRLQSLRDMGAPLADIYAQEDKINQLKRDQAVLDASRLRYISETAPAYEGLASGFKKYVTETGTLYTQLETLVYSTAKNMEGAFSNFFESVFDNTKSWKDRMSSLFKDLANSYIKALSDMLAKQLTSGLFGGTQGKNQGWIGSIGSIVGAIGGLFSGGGGGGGGGSIGYSQPTGVGYQAGEWYHTGKGPGESSSFYRIVPRLHSGIGPDEMPAIIRKDESVLTPAQMKAVGGTFTLNMPISISGTGIDPRAASRLRDDTEKFVIDKIREYSR